jgi:hypothetical protein
MNRPVNHLNIHFDNQLFAFPIASDFWKRYIGMKFSHEFSIAFHFKLFINMKLIVLMQGSMNSLHFKVLFLHKEGLTKVFSNKSWKHKAFSKWKVGSYPKWYIFNLWIEKQWVLQNVWDTFVNVWASVYSSRRRLWSFEGLKNSP